LALGLAAVGHRCYYVNPHLGFQFPRVYFRDRRHRLSFLAPRVIELHLRVLREPVVHHRLPTSRECRTLGDAVGLLVRAADVRKLVQIVSLPFWLDVATRLRQAHGFPIIYDCHDLLGRSGASSGRWWAARPICFVSVTLSFLITAIDGCSDRRVFHTCEASLCLFGTPQTPPAWLGAKR